MHVVTKIFIVLVSLLAVFLVPLVVVYAHNENSYWGRFQAAEAQAASARTELQASRASHGAAVARKDAQIQDLEAANIDFRKQADRQETEIRGLEARLAEAESTDTEITAKIKMLAGAVDASQKLTESLVEELRGLRRDALAAERQKVELDEALRDALAKLDIAIEARKALHEELQRLKDEHSTALDRIAGYVARYGELEGDPRELGVPIDVDLDATIIGVRRSSGQVLAEIDAGSRDGVKAGWVMTIGYGGNFIALLRITDVDIDRSTGVVELEDRTTGRVEVGQKVLARSR